MLGTRAIGLSHIYYDKNIGGFSNVAAGMVIRAIGHGLRIAYIDCSSSAKKFTNFLENLCLSHSFVKSFSSFHIEIFSFLQSRGKISKSILPLVEFHNITEDIFWNTINKFDLIVFDNFNLDLISEYKITNILENREINSEIVFTTSSESDFKKIRDKFDFGISFTYTKNPLLSSSRNIINIQGESRGKSTYSYGHILRKFFEKKDVKMIYFDKEGNFYGEKIFFKALKKWMDEHSFYGSLDYVSTGYKRYEGRKYRDTIVTEDIKEAENGLMLLETSIKKQTPVLAEDLSNVVINNIIPIEKAEKILEQVNRELIITGKVSPKNFLKLSNIVIDVKDFNLDKRSNKETRKGIDF